MTWDVRHDDADDDAEAHTDMYKYLQIQGKTLYLSGRFAYRVKLWKSMPQKTYCFKQEDHTLTLFEDDKNKLLTFLIENGYI